MTKKDERHFSDQLFLDRNEQLGMAVAFVFTFFEGDAQVNGTCADART